MSKEEIIEKLTPIVRTVFANETIDITDDMSASTVPTWTSLSFMQLLRETEKQFGFKFKMMEILKLQTMEAIIVSIQQHIN